jgi:hypothetical protein
MNTDGTDVFTGPASVNVDICVKIAVELPDKTGGPNLLQFARKSQ